MTKKGKAAFPFKVDALGKTASETCPKNTPRLAKRQQVKRIIVLLAVWGLIPISWAEKMISRWGLTHA